MAMAAADSGRVPSRTRQKHVTTACVNCRSRKIKCDGLTPTCSNCTLYSQQCVYQYGLDKRRTPIKDRLASLEAYTKELEALLIANGIPLPSKDESIPFTTAEQHPVSSSSIDRSRRPSRPDTPTKDTTLQTVAVFHPTPDDVSSPLIDQLAGNLGSLQIAEDGQLRFYGATSNLHLLVSGARPQSGKRNVQTPEVVQSILVAAGVGHLVEPELENHLIRLYFCWEDPSIHVVREDIFYRERARCKFAGGTSKFYSEILVNAMCAVGASLTSRHYVHLPEPLVEFFASRAKALLDVEMDSPTLSTVQSLVILSGVAAILTLDARGWLYSGMAARLSTDLGMHLDTQAYVDAGILEVEEASLRRVVFWGTFIHERMWSLYMGRPVSLDEKSITAPPYVPPRNEPKYWKPYVDDYDDFDFPPLEDPIEELHEHNASLCAKMVLIRDTLYSDSVITSLGPQQLYDFASNMRSELRLWHKSLPANLLLDLTSVLAFYVPHVLQLHMQYHCVMILVNRPFFSANLSSFPDVAFSDPMVGRPACTESAKTISKLLQIYRRLYSFRRINIQAVHLIFTASLVHVLNACEATEPSLKNSAWKDLEVCSQALAEMGKGYKNAIRALDVVNGIRDELLISTRELTKRGVTDGTDGTDDTDETFEMTPAKRRRPSGPEDGVITTPAEAANDSLDATHHNTIQNPSINSIDSLFWSELSNLEYPGL